MALKYTRPNDMLLQELAEVSRDAHAVIEYLRAPNSLPLSFPASQLIEIATTLGELPSGTAEGCRVPLEYARVRLPAIRRENILNEDAIALQEDEAVPPLLRGMALDRCMRDLIASVTTALDEYRRQTTILLTTPSAPNRSLT